jgi:very-short-patch-repair endonuclease
MEPFRKERLNNWLRSHDSLIVRSEAVALGMSKEEIYGRLERSEWERVQRNIYRPAAAPHTPLQILAAAVTAAGKLAVASHASAAWLWGLIPRPPAVPEITVPTSWAPRLTQVKVHRSSDLDPCRTIIREGIATTDPLRTLADLGASPGIGLRTLGEAIDRGAATQLVTFRGLADEADRLSRKGRPGIGALRKVLADRHIIGAPDPSELEKRAYQLFKRKRLPTPVCELVFGPEGEYRLDFAYPEPRLAIEVDGYAYHFSPEQLQRDHARRNKAQAQGWCVLVYTWVDVTRDGGRVAREILLQLQSRGGAL